jgi:hypothetical protein
MVVEFHIKRKKVPSVIFLGHFRTWPVCLPKTPLLQDTLLPPMGSSHDTIATIQVQIHSVQNKNVAHIGCMAPNLQVSYSQYLKGTPITEFLFLAFNSRSPRLIWPFKGRPLICDSVCSQEPYSLSLSRKFQVLQRPASSLVFRSLVPEPSPQSYKLPPQLVVAKC